METFYTDPEGFLGTGASLLADLTLLVYVFLIMPAMIAGFVFARRGHHRPHHKWVMISITTANWFFIIFLMIGAVTFDIADNISDQSDNLRYLTPVIHILFGLPGQLLATYVVYRMLQEDYQVKQAKARGETNLQQYWFNNAKHFMRVTLSLWFVAVALGVTSYLIRYEVVTIDDSSNSPVETPPVTEEADQTTTPATTLESETPDQTITPITTQTPPTVEEIVPQQTQSPSDDDTPEPDDGD